MNKDDRSFTTYGNSFYGLTTKNESFYGLTTKNILNYFCLI